MPDLGTYTPGPDCLAARERLLEGIMATWPKFEPRKLVPKEQAPSTEISDAMIAAAEKAVVDRRAIWLRELKARRAIEAELNTPPVNFWEKEFAARARLRAAKQIRAAIREAVR
jgi:hypothetical protein